MMADYRDDLNRAVATFFAGATAAPLTAAVMNISFVKSALIAGLIAVWNLAGRMAQSWLKDYPEDI
jgi:H+/Cl- antiporter ClcA